LNGSGGGRPEFAQGGGKDAAGLAGVLKIIPNMVKGILA